MALVFDKNGNLIHDVITLKIKHDELTTDKIKELESKYFCSKCDTYHRPKYRGKTNQSFLNHQKYAKEVSDSYIYNKRLSKSFRTYDIEKHRRSKGSSKQ